MVARSPSACVGFALAVDLVVSLCSGDDIGECAESATERIVDTGAECLEVTIGSLEHQDEALTFGADTIIRVGKVVRVDDILESSVLGDAVLDERKGLVGGRDVSRRVSDECETVSACGHEGGSTHFGKGTGLVEIVEERAVGLLVLPDGSDNLFGIGSELGESPCHAVARGGFCNGLVDTENSRDCPTMTGGPVPGIVPATLHDVVPETVVGRFITETLTVSPDLAHSHVKVLVLDVQIGLESTIVGENGWDHENAVCPELHFANTVRDGTVCVLWNDILDKVQLIHKGGIVTRVGWVSGICEEDGDAVAHRVTGCTVIHKGLCIWLIVDDVLGVGNWPCVYGQRTRWGEWSRPVDRKVGIVDFQKGLRGSSVLPASMSVIPELLTDSCELVVRETVVEQSQRWSGGEEESDGTG